MTVSLLVWHWDKRKSHLSPWSITSRYRTLGSDVLYIRRSVGTSRLKTRLEIRNKDVLRIHQGEPTATLPLTVSLPAKIGDT